MSFRTWSVLFGAVVMMTRRSSTSAGAGSSLRTIPMQTSSMIWTFEVERTWIGARRTGSR